jgi:hypothetical protein
LFLLSDSAISGVVGKVELNPGSLLPSCIEIEQVSKGNAGAGKYSKFKRLELSNEMAQSMQLTRVNNLRICFIIPQLFPLYSKSKVDLFVIFHSQERVTLRLQ